MNFNYTKIKFGNWLFRNSFPLYNLLYRNFKKREDKHEIDILKKIVKPGHYVLDIGANIGFYAEILSELTGGEGMVYCFEPDSTNFQYLEKNTGDYNNVKLFHNAVSDKNEILKVYKSKLLNVDHRTYPVNNYDSIEEVNAVSIDSLIENKTISKVDIIKIDIQGYEMAAFTGMTKLLTDNGHIRILAEYWPHGFRRAGTSATEFYDFFTQLGYSFQIIREGRLEPLARDYVTANNEGPFEFSFNVLIEKK